MEHEIPFRITLLILCVLGIAIRVYYHWLARRIHYNVSYKEGMFHVIFQRGCGLIGAGLVVAYLIQPPWVEWASLPLPLWLRWTGAGLGFGGLVLLFWTHRALGSNFDSVLHIKANQALVTAGPYRWVRHPMYTAMYLTTAGLALLSANWLVGLVYWGSLTVVVVLRVGKEEAILAEKFGEAYRAYSRRTGRFLPPLFIKPQND